MVEHEMVENETCPFQLHLQYLEVEKGHATTERPRDLRHSYGTGANSGRIAEIACLYQLSWNIPPRTLDFTVTSHSVFVWCL